MPNWFDKVSKSYVESNIAGLYLFTATVWMEAFSGHYRGNWKYHLSGLAVSLVASALDIKSTLPVMRLFNTPEFKEKGLEEEFREGNIFIGKHPSLQRFMKVSCILGSVTAVLSSILPSFGYVYLSSITFVVRNNRYQLQRLENLLQEDPHPDFFRKA